MSTSPVPPPSFPSVSAGVVRTRPLTRVALHWVRRLHLYLGLFLFPWAVLYGFTGFLFNHPPILNELPMSSFDHTAWAGTPMAEPTDLRDVAQRVVEQLQLRSASPAELQWVESEPVRYAGEFAFGKVESESGEISLLLDVHGTGGTIRQARPKPTNASSAISAPWEIVPIPAGQPASFEKLELPGVLSVKLQASLPELMSSLKLSGKNPTLTSVPDLLFVVESGGRRWQVAYNGLKGTVTGKPLEIPEPLPWRNFLLRLHTTHVYPFSFASVKWLWVLGADAIALVLIYWGGSGLLMWWQIKSTRRWGLAVLVVSALVATALAGEMHAVIQGR
ncbi:MAG: hypothetical protein DWH91_10940 [Planctomycetota bacterium]|nr:MAG: hypothetical protein DWH91_10940 [Planctomycetota bacterium]